MSKQQFLIVGGGLAGSFLAARLLLRGQEVVMVDDKDPYAASPVAAGLFNVITGRFGAKSWMANKLVPELRTFLDINAFSSLQEFVHDSLIYRPFKEVAEYNKWTGRSKDDAYEPWADFMESPQLSHLIENPLGGIMIKQCGWLDIPNFLRNLQQLLIENFELKHIQMTADESNLDIGKKTLAEVGAFDQVVFCQGYRAKEHPLFKDLPIIPNKGEVLHLEIPELELPFVLSKKVYLIPLPNQQYICGSTYKNHFTESGPTKEAREEICEHLDKVLKVPYKVLDQRSGIRPTTPNRRPILGTHPEQAHAHFFGGFGTKGVLLAPHFSNLMADYLCGGEWDVLPEVDIARYI